MPSRRRFIPPDSIHHVVNRGNDKKIIFPEPVDYGSFLVLLREARERYPVQLYAYCLMPNHFHLVVSTPRIELSAGMHRLNCLYAMRFNKRYKRSGHLFQNRFDARLVEGDRHARAVSRYVVANPVRAGLCRDWRHWRWSGLGAL
jgi:putative transposase